MSAIYHNLTNWKPQDVILLILSSDPASPSLASSLRTVMSVSLLGEKQELEKMEGEIVSGMMEGETIQLALQPPPLAALSSLMIRDNFLLSSPSPLQEMPVPESSVVCNPIINTVIS